MGHTHHLITEIQKMVCYVGLYVVSVEDKWSPIVVTGLVTVKSGGVGRIGGYGETSFGGLLICCNLTS